MDSVAWILGTILVAAAAVASLIAWRRGAALAVAASAGHKGAARGGDAEMMAQLVAERDAARAATRAKSAYLANMSHELRTPMNAVLGYSEMLLEEAENTEGCEALADDLGKIHSAGQHLLGLITNILDLSKIEAGKMEVCIGQIELLRLFKEVEATARPLVEQNRNTITFDCAADCRTIASDPQLLRQALLNLVSNAAKFTEDGTITVAAGRSPNGATEITVQDTGIGMTGQQVARLFRPYEQAGNDVYKKYGGTGLGLAITRGICDMLGGEIKAESRILEGTTFTITLPSSLGALATSVTPGEVSSQDPTMTEKKHEPDLRVLIVDDDEAAVDLMQKSLGREGFVTTCVYDGKAGLEMARADLPDAIVLDIAMPGMDGWNVLSEIKGDETLKSIPVVMVSSMDQRMKNEKDDPEAYFMKPFNRSSLAETIRRLVRQESGPQEHEQDANPEGEARDVA